MSLAGNGWNFVFVLVLEFSLPFEDEDEDEEDCRPPVSGQPLNYGRTMPRAFSNSAENFAMESPTFAGCWEMVANIFSAMSGL